MLTTTKDAKLGAVKPFRGGAAGPFRDGVKGQHIGKGKFAVADGMDGLGGRPFDFLKEG